MQYFASFSIFFNSSFIGTKFLDFFGEAPIYGYKEDGTVAVINKGFVHNDLGKFQNLDPKSVTFFDVLRHFLAHTGNIKYRNGNLDKIVVILVVDLSLSFNNKQEMGCQSLKTETQNGPRSWNVPLNFCDDLQYRNLS